MNDPIAALVTNLKANAGVTALASTRVYGGELPRADTTSMPRAAVVLKPAGGGGLGRAFQEYGDTRVDVDCYGATPLDAWKLYMAVHDALKQLRRTKVGTTLLHWASVSAGGLTARDPDTDWPVTVSSWQVLAAEIAA